MKKGQWYTNAIIWASNNGIVAGKGDIFDVSSPITRQEMATILRTYAKYKGYNTTDTVSLNNYSDRNEVSSWAVTNMQWAVANGIISGKGTRLAPLDGATRAETAAMLKSFIDMFQ